jgi:PadR family transcriptional regulator, regulatory protein PadR
VICIAMHSMLCYCVCVAGETPIETNGGRWEAQLRKGSLDLAVLAALWRGRLYGLEILKYLEENARLEIVEGTLYPILMRLKEEGLLESVWVSEAAHPRKYYWLTEAGRQRTLKMIETWDSFQQGILRLLVPVKERGAHDRHS